MSLNRSRVLQYGSVRTRRGTAAEWTSVNPVLGDGEMGLEINALTPRFKVGDGATAWTGLPYIGTDGAQGSPGESESYVTGRTGSKFLTAHAALFRSAGYAKGVFATPPIVRLMILGDSVANSMWSVWAGDLSRRMGGNILTGNPVAPNEGVTPAGFKLLPLTGISATPTGSAYEYGPTGQYFGLGSGADTTWGISGSAVVFQAGKVQFVKEPGAGRVKVDVGGVNVVDVDASAASIEFGSVDIANASTSNTTIRVYTTGGPVKILGVHACATSSPGVWYYDASLGGLSLGLAMSQATGRAILGAMIADFKPDAILIEEKENVDFSTDGLGTTYASELEVRGDIIDANKPAHCDVAMTSSNAYVQRYTYNLDQQAAAAANRDTLATFCAARDYLCFDGYAALGEAGVLTTALYGHVTPLVANFRGVHVFGNSYLPGDIVSNSGISYRCHTSTTNAPPNASFFTIWGDAYSAGTTYRQHDVVTSGIYYWSYINGTPAAGNAPPTAPTDSNAYWQMLDGYSLDGTHTNRQADVYRVGLFNSQIGLAASPYACVGAVNETATASRLAGGSVFSYGKAGQEVKFGSDTSSSAVVWWLRFPQKLLGQVSGDSNRVAFAFSQFGNNNAANLAQYAAYLGGMIALDGDGSHTDSTGGKAILGSGTVRGQANSVTVLRRTSGSTTVAGNLSLAELGIGGAGATISMGTAAPVSGTYVAGSRVCNSAPSVGNPKGWICTVSGTPGTWVSEGNL